MKCITCTHELDASMKHALTMNLCPFCGKSVFSNDEFDFRKSIYRILIKNGIENEEAMSRIVDDVSGVLRERFVDAEAESPSDESSGQEEIVVSSRKTEDEELENLPVRDIPPDPRRSAQKPAPLTQADRIALAAREWEALQRDGDDDRHVGRVDSEDAQSDGDDIPFFDGTTAVKIDPAIEAKKQAAIEAKKRLIAAQGSGFKTKPIQRK